MEGERRREKEGEAERKREQQSKGSRGLENS